MEYLISKFMEYIIKHKKEKIENSFTLRSNGKPFESVLNNTEFETPY